MKARWQALALALVAGSVLAAAGCASRVAGVPEATPTGNPATPVSVEKTGSQAAVPREGGDLCLPTVDAISSGVTIVEYAPEPKSKCFRKSDDGSYVADVSVVGHVMDVRGRPLAGATVEVLAASGGGVGEPPASYSDFGPAREVTSTTLSGDFSISVLHGAQYTLPDVLVLNVTREGFKPELLLFQCGTLRVHVRLKPECLD